MGESQNYFQNLEPLFRKYALPDIRKSQEYQHAANNLMDILLLADRVLAASVETVEAGRVKNIADKLSKVQLSQDVSSHTGDDLLRDAELWLKGVLFLIDPISYMEKKDKKYFTLYSLLRDLDLLSQAETEKGINTYGEITDTIRQKILLAYRYRNPLTHNPQDYPETIKSNFFTFALIIFIAPIIKYQDEISEKLKGLVSSQLPSNTPEVIDLLRLFEGERRKHLEIFGGRNPQLDEIQKRLEGDLRERGAYLLLTGLEGIGKSAFCAQLINNLTQAISPIGRYGEEVRKYASWLPGIIFHSGKQSKVPLEIAKSIITQANTMLLEPVEINFKKRETDVSGFEHSLNYRQDNKFRGIQNSTLSYATHSELPNPLLIQPENKSQLPLLEEIRRKIYAILEKVVQEYGNVILIIDALDEISTFGKDLIFLPETLPPGASALLTTRDNTKASQFIAQYCDNYKVRLNKLKEDEISFIVKSDSADPKELALLHKKTWEKSRGWPIIVADAARKAKFTKKLGEIDIDKTPYELFERQAREWTEASQKEILYHVLLLLAIFEPACPLELSLVQGFLLHTQFHLTQSEIRYLLHPVAHQVEGLDEGQIKLAFKAFAEHIRNAYLSPKDTRNFLGRITVWLKEEEDLDAKTTGLFLSYWADATQVKDQRIQAIIENFNEHVRASKDANFVYIVFKHVISELDKNKKMLSYMEKLLLTAAEKGEVKAMLEYSSRLKQGLKLEKNAEKGNYWLRNAAEEKSPHAMFILGNLLLEGEEIEKNQEEGEKWLYQAAEMGDQDAIGILSIRLLEGLNIKQNTQEGEEWLRRLVDIDNLQAMRILGNRLLDGDNLKQNLEEGEKWLRKSAEQGDLQAVFSLGIRLLDGDNLQQDEIEGKEWLFKAAKTDNPSIMRMLGLRLLNGENITQDVKEGEMWLRKAAKADDVASIVMLGNRLLDGRNLEQDRTEGENWLRKAVAADDEQAMRILGNRLLDGDNLEQDTEEGEKWLYKAAETGEQYAMRVLGNRLLDGDNLGQDISEGEKWLRKAADTEEGEAMRVLGARLLNGDNLKQDAEEGEKWLRKAVAQNDILAMVSLGAALLRGDSVQQNIEEGEGWLRKAAESRDEQAMRILGINLLDGEVLKQDVIEGEKWLQESASLGDAAAMSILGGELLSGENLKLDAKEGIEWLEEASELGNANAKSILGRFYYMQGNLLKAAKLFLESFSENAELSGNNLAYMVRRDEISDGIEVPKIDLLLEKSLQDKDPFGIVNKALCLAQGVQCKRNWKIADNLIASIEKNIASDLLDWWHDELQDDPEGDLVVGWLVRHGLVNDPENMNISKRFKIAQQGGWDIPNWMMKKIS